MKKQVYFVVKIDDEVEFGRFVQRETERLNIKVERLRREPKFDEKIAIKFDYIGEEDSLIEFEDLIENYYD